MNGYAFGLLGRDRVGIESFTHEGDWETSTEDKVNSHRSLFRLSHHAGQPVRPPRVARRLFFASHTHINIPITHPRSCLLSHPLRLPLTGGEMTGTTCYLASRVRLSRSFSTSRSPPTFWMTAVGSSPTVPGMGHPLFLIDMVSMAVPLDFLFFPSVCSPGFSPDATDD